MPIVLLCINGHNMTKSSRFHAKNAILKTCLCHMIIKSHSRAPVLLNLLNSLRKIDKMLDKSCFCIKYLFSTRLINSTKHEHSCKILY